MKYAYYGFAMLFFGLIGLVIIVMMQSITINNDSEYYNLKEAMRAAMVESIDITCYRKSDLLSIRTGNRDTDDECGAGKLKISEQKFVENFTRRFLKTLGGDANNYYIDFYDIIESPPKVSVVIKSKNDNYSAVSGQGSINIVNSLSGILEQDLLIKLVGKKYKVINLETINQQYTDLIEEENKRYEEMEKALLEAQKKSESLVDKSRDATEETVDDDSSIPGFIFEEADTACASENDCSAEEGGEDEDDED